MSGSGHRRTRHGRTESHRRILARRDQLPEDDPLDPVPPDEEPPDPWACPRPDKRHHDTEETARRRLAEHDDKDGVRRDVKPCPCGAGWVWGRRYTA